MRSNSAMVDEKILVFLSARVVLTDLIRVLSCISSTMALEITEIGEHIVSIANLHLRICDSSFCVSIEDLGGPIMWPNPYGGARASCSQLLVAWFQNAGGRSIAAANVA